MRDRWRKQLGTVHSALARSEAAVRLAVKVRNQANAVVSAHFSDLSVSVHGDENGEYRLVDACAPDAENFIDAGANVGDWSERFARAMKTNPVGLLFEAGFNTAEKAKRRFEEFGEIHVLNQALSDFDGEVAFFEDEVRGRTSSMTRDNAGVKSAEHRVLVTYLDKEVQQRGWDKVTFLKIDTEGQDFFVLRGARKLLSDQRIEVIQFECNNTWVKAGATFTGAIELLRSNGYEVYHLRPTGLHSVDFELFGDCYGYGNWVALTEAMKARLQALRRD